MIQQAKATTSDASPSATSSCTSPECMKCYQALPSETTIEGRTIRLLPLDPDHIDSLWDQIQDVDNARLFTHCYGCTCGNEAQLWNILTDYGKLHKNSLTLTILDKKTLQVLGWIVSRSRPSDAGAVHCSMFLPRYCRSERGSETLHYIACLVFDELEYERLEWRVGKLTESTGPRGGPMGITLIGVLCRQLRDESRSQESDKYVLPRSRWPNVYAATKAWLDSREGRESGEHIGSGSLALAGWGL